jgi:hypothetical protein
MKSNDALVTKSSSVPKSGPSNSAITVTKSSNDATRHQFPRTSLLLAESADLVEVPPSVITWARNAQRTASQMPSRSPTAVRSTIAITTTAISVAPRSEPSFGNALR